MIIAICTLMVMMRFVLKVALLESDDDHKDDDDHHHDPPHLVLEVALPFSRV